MTTGKRISKWRVEVLMLALVIMLGHSAVAAFQGDIMLLQWCSQEPVYTYVPAANVCAGSAGDCYSCVVWGQ